MTYLIIYQIEQKVDYVGQNGQWVLVKWEI